MSLWVRIGWFDSGPFPVFLPTPARIDDQPENRADDSDGN